MLGLIGDPSVIRSWNRQPSYKQEIVSVAFMMYSPAILPFNLKKAMEALKLILVSWKLLLPPVYLLKD